MYFFKLNHMRKWILFFASNFIMTSAFCQYDWDNVEIGPSPGSGMVWELQTDVSDDFNYDEPAVPWVATIGGKWTNFYHNAWSGPKPTVWKRDHVKVEDGKFKIKTSRPPGETVVVDGQTLDVTYLGCATSVHQVIYPIYIEASVKIMNSVLASNVWLLSGDDTQEIDICEAYGGERWTNPYFSDQRLHLSHHVFIRDPFQDWQPSDEGTFYTDGSTLWREDFHTIGVNWIDSVNLEYYVDGQLVRKRSGMEEIDPVYFTNVIDPGDPTNDTRTGLSKPMDIILNTEDQDWRALMGLTPSDDELMNEEDHIFEIDWIRAYKAIEGNVGPVTEVIISPSEVEVFPESSIALTANIIPNNALDLSVTWESLNMDIATVDNNGLVTTITEGMAKIVVTTNENNKRDTATVIVNGIAPSLEFVNEFSILNFNYQVGGELSVSANFHAGSGNTLVDGGQGGARFWLREISPGWNVVNDYVVSDASVIGQESGVASATISLVGVPAVSEIPADNWYFLFVTFQNSDGNEFDYGIYPINILQSSSVFLPEIHQLEIFPNPAQSLLNIKNPISSLDTVIEIISSTGQKVNAQNISNDSSLLQIDIAQLPKGLYFLRLSSNEIYVSSFVKE